MTKNRRKGVLWLTLAAAILAMCAVFFTACNSGEDPSQQGGEQEIAVESVTLDRQTLTLEAGGSATLVATVLPADASDRNVTWSSSAPSVVSVDGGTVHALARGTATITAASGNGKTATCTVTVNAETPPAVTQVEGATIEGLQIYMRVDENTDSVPLLDKVTVSAGTWKLYSDILGQHEIVTKIAAGASGVLEDGENVFYLILTGEYGATSVYTLTVYRAFTAYTVSYARGADEATGDIPAAAEYKPGAQVTLAAADTFARDGYAFVGWSDGENTYNAGEVYTMPEQDVTFTAQWEELTYELRYARGAYDATGSIPATAEYKAGEQVTLAAADTFTRDEYVFVGWNDGEDTYQAGEVYPMPARNVTLTAQWEEVTYTLSYARGADSATGEIPASSEHLESAVVTLLGADTFEREGYLFKGWSDGETIYEAGAVYIMPARDVTMTAQWESALPDGTELIASIPDSELTTQAVCAGNTATAHWFAEYMATGLRFTVYVADTTPYIEEGSILLSDYVDITISKVQSVFGYSDGTIALTIDAEGNFVIRNLGTDQYVDDTGVTVMANYFTLEDKRVDGYKIVATVPYELTEVTAARKNAALCFGFANAVTDGGCEKVFDGTYGTRYDNVITYMALTEDNAFAENPYLAKGEFWGDGNENLIASSFWDLSGDDGTEDASVELMRDDNADNYLYIKNSNAKEFYAEVQLNVKGFGKDDLWPKFGMTVTTADGERGFFFYVDAIANYIGNAINTDSIDVGLATRSGAGAGKYIGYTTIGNLGGGATSADYQGDNYITLGIYRNGNFFRLYVQGRRCGEYTFDIAADDEVYVGLASFSLLLNAKGYSFETENLGDYEITQEDVDYLFLGDSYLNDGYWDSFWNTYRIRSAANLAMGATEIADWQRQIGTIKQRYNPQKIVFHIGVYDIDNGASAQTVAADLDALIAAYRQAFPDAQIYWITIADNMLFQSEWADYHTVNAHMKDKSAEGNFYVIDVASLITPDENGDTMHWFCMDRFHFDVDGYSVFGKTVNEALGIARTQTGSGLGNVTAQGAPASYYTAGWEYDGSVWHNAGDFAEKIGAEAQLFISDAYAADIYAEAKLSIASLYSTDYYSKAGILIASEQQSYFFFINLSTVNINLTGWDNNTGALTYRAAGEDWVWREADFFPGNGGYVGLGDEAYDYNDDPNAYKTLGVLKDGSDLYFFAGGKPVGGKIASKFAPEEKVTVSVFNFNVNMYAKDGYSTTDADLLAEKLALATGALS